MFTMKADTSKFFDRVIVETEVDRIEFEGLRRNAMYIRKVARNSIRKKSRPSTPGQPPRSVRGDLKRGIEAHFERGVNESVVGPMGFGWSKGSGLLGAPNTLEFGGDSVIDRSVVRKVGDGGEVRVVGRGGKEVRPGVRVVYARIRTQAQAARATRINREIFAPQPVRVAARPFMAPALDKSLPKLAPMWAMSVRSS